MPIPTNELKVLILEDNAEKLRTIADFLRSYHEYHLMMDHAADAASARDRIRSTKYDIFVADLVVPRIVGDAPTRQAGRELLDALFESDEPNMPSQIVGLSAHSDQALLESEWFSQHAVSLVYFDSSSDSWQMPLLMRLRQTLAAKRATENTSRKFGAFLGIVCALDDEFAAVRRLPWEWEETSFPDDPGLYVRGRMSGPDSKPIVLTLSTEMGSSSAAIAATKLIFACAPKYLAIVGITAGMPSRSQLGDVIAAEECWDWGMGKYEVRDGEMIFLPAPRQIGIDATMRSALRRLRQDSAGLDAIKSNWPAKSPNTSLSVLLGPVASGSAVIAAKEMSEQVATQHRKLLAVEMETYGVFAAAKEAPLPQPMVLSLKSVSDFANEGKDDSTRHYACYAAAQALYLLAEKYLPS